MPQVKDTEYLQISARIRAMETRLLNKERRERMIEAKTLSDALRVLSECGYGEAENDDYEKVLAHERAKVFSDLYSSSPTSQLVDFFRIKYDYHNLKTLIKSEALGQDFRRLLSDSGRVSAKKAYDAFEMNTLSALPSDMEAAAEAAREILASTGDPQLCDLALDRACYGQMEKTALASGSAFLQGYFKQMADSANLRALARIRKMEKGNELLRSALIDGGSVSCDSIRTQAVAGASTEAIFASTAFKDAAAMSGASLTAFERECDNVLVAYLTAAKLVPFGDAVLVAFAAAKEAELTAVRIILAGKAAGISGDALRERLRESYV